MTLLLSRGISCQVQENLTAAKVDPSLKVGRDDIVSCLFMRCIYVQLLTILFLGRKSCHFAYLIMMMAV